MSRLRLGENQLHELATAIATEHVRMLEWTAVVMPPPPGLQWWRTFLDPRRGRALTAGLEHYRSRLNDLLAGATGVDVETADLEMRALEAQVARLWQLAWEWEQGGLNRAGSPGEDTVADAWLPAAFVPAVEALAQFYFGEAPHQDPVVADTQLVWLAGRQVAPLIAGREARKRRTQAFRRYSELWEAWAASGVFATSPDSDG